MVYAIILAGGEGSRAGQSMPKQYIEVNEKPVLVYTLDAFEQNQYIDCVCVVAAPQWHQEIWSYKERFAIKKLKKVVPAGITGLNSLYMGVQGIHADSDDIVVIHDGVRPFITQSVINNNIIMMQHHDVVVSAIPCVETLIKSDDGINSECMLPRDGLFRVQTPQSFKYHIIENLLKDIKDWLDIKEPSAFAYYMNCGGKIAFSLGSEKNIKLTYPDDIKYFRRLFTNIDGL